MASRSVKMSPKEFPDAFQSVQNKYLEPIWRQSGPNLAQHWCQGDLNWLQVGSKIGTSWSTKRQSRETAAFVVNSEPFWHAIRCDLGQSWGEVEYHVDSKVATNWPTKRQSRETAAFGAHVEPTWGQFRCSSCFQILSKCPFKDFEMYLGSILVPLELYAICLLRSNAQHNKTPHNQMTIEPPNKSIGFSWSMFTISLSNYWRWLTASHHDSQP